MFLAVLAVLAVLNVQFVDINLLYFTFKRAKMLFVFKFSIC